MSKRRSRGNSTAQWLAAFLTGLLFGGLAGAVAMLLLAPRSGEKTRAKIQKQGAQLRDRAAESLDDVVTEAGDKAHEFTDSVQAGVGEVQHRAQDMFGR